MTYALPPWFGATVAFLICGAAAWKGEAEERVVAAGFLLSLAATVLLRDKTWPQVQWAAFAADSSLFILLLVVVLRTAKSWPFAAASVQLVAVMTHVAKMMDASLHQWPYITAGVVWSYLLLLVLAAGVWKRRRA